MAHVHFDRRFGKGEIGRQELHFFRLGHLTRKEVQQTEQRPEINVFTQHNAFDLKKVGRMGGINLVVAEAAGNRKILQIGRAHV